MDLCKSYHDSEFFFYLLSTKFSQKMTKEDEELNMNYSSYRTTCGKYTDPDEPSAFRIDSSTLTSSVEKKDCTNTSKMLLLCM